MTTPQKNHAFALLRMAVVAVAGHEILAQQAPPILLGEKLGDRKDRMTPGDKTD